LKSTHGPVGLRRCQCDSIGGGVRAAYVQGSHRKKGRLSGNTGDIGQKKGVESEESGNTGKVGMGVGCGLLT